MFEWLKDLKRRAKMMKFKKEQKRMLRKTFKTCNKALKMIDKNLKSI